MWGFRRRSALWDLDRCGIVRWSVLEGEGGVIRMKYVEAADDSEEEDEGSNG